jgi:hypothetical protein
MKVVTIVARAIAAAAALAWQRTPRPREIRESLAYSRARRRMRAGSHAPGPHHAGRRHPVLAPLRQGRRRAALTAAWVAVAALLAAGGFLAVRLAGSREVSATARASGSPTPRHAAPAFPVQVSADVAAQPGNRPVAGFMSAYFAAVAAGDYPAWSRLFLPAAILPPPGEFSFAAQHVYRDVTLARLVFADGTVSALVTFATRPAAARAPGTGGLEGAGARCAVVFALYRQGPSYLLEALPAGGNGPDVNCGL